MEGQVGCQEKVGMEQAAQGCGHGPKCWSSRSIWDGLVGGQAWGLTAGAETEVEARVTRCSGEELGAGVPAAWLGLASALSLSMACHTGWLKQQAL